ncbi:MAG: hypothetical protein WKF94_12070 [Solirubrobacteraceae bacterium]
MCILDTEASVEHLVRGTSGGADALLAVVEPYPRSLLTGLRTVRLARDLGIAKVVLVANKVAGPRDEETVRAYAAEHGLPVLALIPDDPVFRAADLTGAAVMDLDASGPAARSVGVLADALTA